MWFNPIESYDACPHVDRSGREVCIDDRMSDVSDDKHPLESAA